MRKRADDARPTCLDRDAYILFPRGYPTRPHSARPPARPSVRPSVPPPVSMDGIFHAFRVDPRGIRLPSRHEIFAVRIWREMWASSFIYLTSTPANRATRLMQSASAHESRRFTGN
jgi:hypothetical protein